jgi:hypothetical protein
MIIVYAVLLGWGLTAGALIATAVAPATRIQIQRNTKPFRPGAH